jgi:hypothetical protein
MNLHLQPLIISELFRLESLNYIGLLGTKYLSSEVTTPDNHGNRVTFINIQPNAGWAIVAFGPDSGEAKHKFLRDLNDGWVYGGVEKIEAVH